MNAGDMLYIPPFWFHEVQGQGDSLSVNHWWNSMGLEDMLMKKIDNIASFETATEMPREMAGVVEGARADNNPGEGGKAPWEYGGVFGSAGQTRRGSFRATHWRRPVRRGRLLSNWAAGHQSCKALSPILQFEQMNLGTEARTWDALQYAPCPSGT